MINPFFKNYGPFKIKNLLNQIDNDNLDNCSNIVITDIKDLVEAEPNTITFFHSKKYENLASKTKASYCITTKNLFHILPASCKPIIVNNVLISTAKITQMFYPDSINDDFDLLAEDISKTTFNKKIKFGNNVLIGKNVKIGNNC